MAVRRASTRPRGFTLVELMVTLFVMAILVMIAAPNFRDLLRRNQVSSAANALLADIAYARSEAVTRGNIVSICASTDHESCSGDSAYESGWIVYTYTLGNGVANTAYDSGSSPGKNIILRVGDARENMSIQAIDSDVISFGTQGQVQPTGKQLKFQTCYRPSGETGTGSSTKAVPGSELTVNGSGSASSQSMAVKSTCDLS